MQGSAPLARRLAWKFTADYSPHSYRKNSHRMSIWAAKASKEDTFSAALRLAILLNGTAKESHSVHPMGDGSI